MTSPASTGTATPSTPPSSSPGPGGPGDVAATGSGGPPPAPESLRDRLARRWPRVRWVFFVSLAVFVATLVVALSTGTGSGGELDPDSYGEEGARAVAEILRDEGVEVVRVTRSTEAARLADGGTTLVVVQPHILAREQLDRIAATDAPVIALVAPDQPVLDVLAPGVRAAGAPAPSARPPACDLEDARVAGDAFAGSAVYSVDPRAAGTGTAVCYPEEDQPDAGSYVVAPGEAGREVRVLGQRRLLFNRYLADEGNAALSLRALGSQAKVVWYVPDPLEVSTAPGRPTLGDLIPRWVPLVAVQLALAVLVTLLWRGRRLGRLVPEPLPVVVRATETEEGRARLYRQARARGRAAATLRTAALRRLAGRLAVDAETTPTQVAALVAQATGRPAPEVHAVLLGSAPTDDRALVALADQLDALERQVATTPHAEGPGRTQQP